MSADEGAWRSVMGWKPIREAAAEGDLSLATLKRRVAAEEVPSYVEADGRRMVWLDPSPPPAWAVRLEEKIDQLLGRGGRLVELPLGAEDPRPLARPEERSAPERVPSAPFSRGRYGFDAEALLAGVCEIQAEAGLTLAAIEREAGVSRGFLSAALKGAKRGAKARKTWAKIEAWVAGRRARRAA